MGFAVKKELALGASMREKDFKSPKAKKEECRDFMGFMGLNQTKGVSDEV